MQNELDRGVKESTQRPIPSPQMQSNIENILNQDGELAPMEGETLEKWYSRQRDRGLSVEQIQNILNQLGM